MSQVAVLIMMLAQQGYWFGGDTGRVMLEWNPKLPVPAAAVCAWDLKVGEATVAGGKAAMPADRSPLRIEAPIPKVRVRTTMQLSYRVSTAEGQAPITQGTATLNVFPHDILDGIAARHKHRRIMVVDAADGLPALLDSGKIAHTRLDDVSKLSFTQPDVILIGTDRLSASGTEQEAMLALARGGANVVIFPQSKPRSIVGYDVIVRAAPVRLAWHDKHPLLAGLSAEDRDSWLRGLVDRRADAAAIRLPADEPALEIAFWPRELPGREPVAIDALLAIKAEGRGRLILCQIPLGPWSSDPRSQILIKNILDYTLAAPEPTPPPSRRSIPAKPAPPPERNILAPSPSDIPQGAQP